MTATIRPATKPEQDNRWCIRFPDCLIQPPEARLVSSVRHPKDPDRQIPLAEPVELAAGVWYVVEYWPEPAEVVQPA